MRVLWIVRRVPYLGVQFDSELYKAFTKIVGEDNCVFYGASDLPKLDNSGIPFYPENYKSFDKYRDSNFRVLLSKIVEEEKPDIVVLTDVNNASFIDMSLPSGTKVARVTFMEDPHSEWHDRFAPLLDRGELDVIFVRTYGNGAELKVKERCPLGYSPWAVPSSMFYDKHIDKTIDVYLAGVHEVPYPLRLFMNYVLRGEITYKPFVNYFKYKDMNCVCGDKKLQYKEYLDMINKSKIVAFDSGMFKGAVMKYFEVMASNSLVLADLPADYKALGFEPDENMVEVNFDNFEEKVREYVQNESERKRIAKNGMDLILKYHTVEERAKQLLAQFEEVVNAKREGRKFDYRNVKGDAGRMLSILERDNTILSRCMNDGQEPLWTEWHNETLEMWIEIVRKQTDKKSVAKILKKIIRETQ